MAAPNKLGPQKLAKQARRRSGADGLSDLGKPLATRAGIGEAARDPAGAAPAGRDTGGISGSRKKC
ncbi:hypothetical protein TRIP_B250288 [uncultured Desulfatiglans sp.]|nr:hypothetical protein TRIP_B250288 [uncultured Desulfatiglans sp.]